MNCTIRKTRSNPLKRRTSSRLLGQLRIQGSKQRPANLDLQAPSGRFLLAVRHT